MQQHRGGKVYNFCIRFYKKKTIFIYFSLVLLFKLSQHIRILLKIILPHTLKTQISNKKVKNEVKMEIQKI